MAASVLPYLTVLSNIRCNLIPHQVKRNYYFQPYSDGFLKGYTLQCCPKAMVFNERYCRCVTLTKGQKTPHSAKPYKHKSTMKSNPPFKVHSSLSMKKNKKNNQNYKVKTSAIFHDKRSLPHPVETGRFVQPAHRDVDRIVPVYPKRFHIFNKAKQLHFATKKNKKKTNYKNKPKFRFFKRKKFFGKNRHHHKKQSISNHIPSVKRKESKLKSNIDGQKLDRIQSNTKGRVLGINGKGPFREPRPFFLDTTPFHPSFATTSNQHGNNKQQRNDVLIGDGIQTQTGKSTGISVQNSGIITNIQDLHGGQNGGSLVGSIHGEAGVLSFPTTGTTGNTNPNQLVQTDLNTLHLDGIMNDHLTRDQPGFINNDHMTQGQSVTTNLTPGDKIAQNLVQNIAPNGDPELIQITNDGLLPVDTTSQQGLPSGFDFHHISSSNFGKDGNNVHQGTVSITQTGGVLPTFSDVNNFNSIATEIINPISQLELKLQHPKTNSFDQVQMVDSTISLKSKDLMKSFENEAVFLEDISGKIATSGSKRKGASTGLSIGDSIAVQLEHFRKMNPRSIDLQNTKNQGLTNANGLSSSSDLLSGFSTSISTDLGRDFSTQIGSVTGFKTPTNSVSAGSFSTFRTPTNPASVKNQDPSALLDKLGSKSNILFSGFEVNEGNIFDKLKGENPTILEEGIQSKVLDTSTTGILNQVKILRQGLTNNKLFENVELKTGTNFVPIPTGTVKHSSDTTVIKNGNVITKLAEFVDNKGKVNPNVDKFKDEVLKKTIILTNSNRIPDALKLNKINPEIIPPQPNIPVSLQKQELEISKINTKTMRFAEILPGDICLGCKMDGGVGYTNHPTSCDRFVVCYPTDGGMLKPVTQLCPYGLFWSQSALTCKLTKDVFCPHEVCKSQLDKYQYASKRTCRSYWECQNGISVPRCCPWGYSYLDGIGCIEDSTCEIPDVACSVDSTNYVVEWGGVCDKRPVTGKNNLYERKNHTIWIEEKCPPGWIYKVELCECTKITELSPPDYIFDGHKCVPEIYLPFTSDFADHSGNNVYVRVDNASLISGAACFDGQSALAIPAFANMDLGGTLFIHVRYKQRNPSANLQTLVFNGDCGKTPTLVLGTKPSGNSVSVLTNLNEEKEMWVISKSSVTDWRDVWLKLENGNLVLQTKDHITSTPLNGAISRSECGMKIGWGKGFDNFVGCIDEVSIHRCHPQPTV